MIEVFYYSIANKKRNDVIDAAISDLKGRDYISPQDKNILNHCETVAEKGNYPSTQYFSTFYPQSSMTMNSLSEILVYVDRMKDYYRRQGMVSGLLSTINSTNATRDLVTEISKLVIESEEGESADLETYIPHSYSDEVDTPFNEGIQCGVSEIDNITNGWQGGTVASICAFTGEGKTTFALSAMFNNVLAGRKVCLVTIEMPVKIMWLMIQARYLYQVKGMEITTQDLVMRRLTDEKLEELKKHDEDFKKDIQDNLLIVDEGIFSKDILLNWRSICKLFDTFQAKLGGLELVCWDHVGQLELLFPDHGNQIIKAITSATTNWNNNKGGKVATLFCVQTNRQGRTRAARREGLYDLMAISDLNEIERSSTYCIFMYTTDDSKIVQETKVCMIKHRLGAVLNEPTIVTFNPAVITVGSSVERISSEGEFDSMITSLDGLDDF